MAQLKDLIVDGTAKFNGDVEFTKPVAMEIKGNAETATQLGLSGNNQSLGKDIYDKFYLIATYNTTDTSWNGCNCKFEFVDLVTGANRATVFVHVRHDGTNKVWRYIQDSAPLVTGSTCADKFYVVFTSNTEVQLWVQLDDGDYYFPNIRVLFNDGFVFSTEKTIADTLPDGDVVSGIYDNMQHTAYGECTTASATAIKTVTISDRYWDMRIGSIITVKFANTNTAANPSLNVNNLGAKPIIYNTSAITTSNLVYAGSANRYIQYVYTGTAFVFAGWSVDANTTYSAATQSANGLMSSSDKTKLDSSNIAFGICSTAANVAAKVITIDGNSNWKLGKGSIIIIKFSTTNTAANPTFNVNGSGAKSIRYYNSIITTENLSYAGLGNAYKMYIYDGSEYVYLGRSFESWRGIQDNLTSSSKSDSLSANQGKILKTEIDKINEKLNQTSASDNALQCINGAI